MEDGKVYVVKIPERLHRKIRTVAAVSGKKIEVLVAELLEKPVEEKWVESVGIIQEQK